VRCGGKPYPSPTRQGSTYSEAALARPKRQHVCSITFHAGRGKGRGDSFRRCVVGEGFSACQLFPGSSFALGRCSSDDSSPKPRVFIQSLARDLVLEECAHLRVLWDEHRGGTMDGVAANARSSMRTCSKLALAQHLLLNASHCRSGRLRLGCAAACGWIVLDKWAQPVHNRLAHARLSPSSIASCVGRGFWAIVTAIATALGPIRGTLSPKKLHSFALPWSTSGRFEVLGGGDQRLSAMLGMMTGKLSILPSDAAWTTSNIMSRLSLVGEIPVVG
jgi:hypothetical protein